MDTFDFFYPPKHEDFKMVFFPQKNYAQLLCLNTFHQGSSVLVHKFEYLPDLTPYNIMDKMPLLLTFS